MNFVFFNPTMLSDIIFSVAIRFPCQQLRTNLTNLETGEINANNDEQLGEKF